MPKFPLVPASLFSMLPGIMGLATTWRAAHHLWGLPGEVGEGLVALGALVWLLLAVLYGLKWVLAFEAAKAEIMHPVLGAFVALVGVGTMLVAIGITPYWAGAWLLFAVGLILAYGFGIWRTSLIWRGGRDPVTTTPALYLPLVATSFVAAIGLGVFGFPDWAQLAFGAGFFSWLAIESVLLHRLYNAEALADAMRPTLGIQLAPPAVGAFAYIQASGTSGDFLVHAFIGYAILQMLILGLMGPWISRRFVPSLWGFSFGATALASACLTLELRGDIGAIAILAVPAFAVANFVVVALLLGTAALLATGRLLGPPAPARA